MGPVIRPASPRRAPSPSASLRSSSQVEEFYVITWESKKEQIFELPTGGAAIMRSGPNLLKLARKEQCQALTTVLRTKVGTSWLGWLPGRGLPG